jgi:hypothetical protein
VGVHNTDYTVDDVCDSSVSFRLQQQSGAAAGLMGSGETKLQVVKSRRRDSSLGGDSIPRFLDESPTPLRSVATASQAPSLCSPAASEEKNDRISSLDSDGMSEANPHLLSLRQAAASAAPRNGRLKVNRIVGPEAYYMGIVDFQQLYNLSKKAERFIKIHVKGDSPEGLSCLEPVAYRQRYCTVILPSLTPAPSWPLPVSVDF